MDNVVAMVLVISVFALLGVAVLIRFRRSGGIKVKGPFGTRFEASGTNALSESESRLGISVTDIKSQAGGVRAEDKTGQGINAKRVEAEKDIVLLSSRGNSQENSDPK